MNNPEHLRPNDQRRPVLLIADDEVVIRNVAQITLERAGYSVLAASDGEEALAISRRFPGHIQLLLTDINMPKMDGFKLREHIIQERPGTFVLLMSGQVNPGAEFHFLPKPFTPAVLVQAVGRSLCRRAAGG